MMFIKPYNNQDPIKCKNYSYFIVKIHVEDLDMDKKIVYIKSKTKYQDLEPMIQLINLHRKLFRQNQILVNQKNNLQL